MPIPNSFSPNQSWPNQTLSSGTIRDIIHNIDAYIYNVLKAIIGGVLLVSTKVGGSVPVSTTVGSSIPISTKVGGKLIVE